MHFRVEAVYHEVLSPQDAECLSEMGFEMPESEPSPAWTSPGGGRRLREATRQHGALQFDLPGDFANGRTNEGGVSTINFTPKDEAAPGIGRVVTDSGGLVPRALWGFKFKNPFGSITQVLFPMLVPELTGTSRTTSRAASGSRRRSRSRRRRRAASMTPSRSVRTLR